MAKPAVMATWYLASSQRMSAAMRESTLMPGAPGALTKRPRPCTTRVPRSLAGVARAAGAAAGTEGVAACALP